MAALEIPPKLDGRDLAALLREARELRPFYTPEWQAAAGDAGTALLEIVAGLLAGTIERLDRAPYKHFLAFLDLLGVKLSPAQPARAPLTFLLSDGATEPVVVPARSQAAAKPADGGDPVVFETESAFVATPARLVGVLSAVPDADKVFDHRPGLEAGGTAALFNGVNLQEHSLYLGHDDLFDVKGPVVIELAIKPFLASEPVTWEYFAETEAKWMPLTATVESKESLLVLTKSTPGAIAKLVIGGIEQRWIRCIVRPGFLAEASGMTVNSIQASVRPLGRDGIRPDLAFTNDVELPLDQAFHPFGQRPRTFDVFYVASREAFSKKGARISLHFELLEPLAVPSPDLVLSWEYWDSRGWRAIPQIEAGTGRPAEDSMRLTVSFDCPGDLAPVEVAGQESLWIRARITSGDFGRETFKLDLETGQVAAEKNGFHSPKVQSLTIKYEPERSALAVLTQNNLDLQAWDGQGLLRPFVPLESGPPALYLGFDRPLEKGPLSFFFALEEQKVAEGARPRIEWQYLRRRSGEAAAQWAALEVLDDTQGLTRSGTVQLNPPPDLARDRRFGLDVWWLRAAAAPAAELRGLFLNTAWAVQGETIEAEALGSGTGLPGQRFATAKAPVSGEEVWIDELGTLSDGERKALAARPDVQVRQRTDETGRLLAFEILWRPVADLALAGPADRVYAVDCAAGLVEMGGGDHGRAVPLGRDNVRASYRAGGGAQGNVPAGTITALRTTLPTVDSTVNPVPAAGGADTEPLARAVERGPRALRHRGRAVTCSDFEVLAREASPAVARARCLGHFDEAGEETPGRVTVVIVPESLEARPFPTPALRQRVERFLAGCAPNTAGVRVVGPAYVEVRVTAELVPLEPGLAPQVEAAAFRRLAEFLHPLTGGYEGLGWEFGRRPCLSDFFPLFEALPGVDHVASLAATLQPVVPAGEPPAAATEITLDRPGDSTLAGHVLVYGGDHRLQSRMS